MEDLSHLAASGPWVTSQAGGNMMSSNAQAMSGPGSEPVDPLPDRAKQGNPSLDMGAERPVGTEASRRPVTYNPAAVTWKVID